MDIKRAFDHILENQILKICQKLQLSKSLCYWIKFFLQDRKMQLKFDGNSQEITDIEIGIPQESPISPILFLIYIKFLFAERKSSINERILSYLVKIRDSIIQSKDLVKWLEIWLDSKLTFK